LVVYMAMKHLAAIAGRLIDGGRAGGTPVAIVSNAALLDQRVLETTLVRAAADAEATGMQPPCVVVIGEVARLRAGLDWLGAITAGRTLDPDPLRLGRGRRTG